MNVVNTVNRVAFTAKSSNAKVGPMPVTTSSEDTCPPECPLYRNGCYAKAGFHTRMHWDKVTSGERGLDHGGFMAKISRLKPNTLWRHNVAGDLQGENGHIDGPKLWDLVQANTGKRGFTYTHYSPTKGENKGFIEGANRAGFTVNMSCNSPQEAIATLGTIAAPLVTIVPSDYWAEGNTVGPIIRCPAEYKEAVNCKSCQLCQRAERKTIVGFTVHGTKAKQAAEVIASC